MGSMHSMYLGDEPLRILGERGGDGGGSREQEEDLTVSMLLSTQNHEMRVTVS